MIDTVNHAHKRGLFGNIDTVRQIKDLRNDISHEYIDDALQDLFEEIIKLTPSLIEIAETTLVYTQQYQK